MAALYKVSNLASDAKYFVVDYFSVCVVGRKSVRQFKFSFFQSFFIFEHDE